MKTSIKTSAFVAAVLGVALAAQAGAPTPNYLTFTAQKADSTVKFGWDDAKDFEINTNGTWETYTKNAVLTLKNVGDKVQVRARNLITGSSTTKRFVLDGKVAASGSVTSLIDANGGNPQVTLPEKCFFRMFYNQTALTAAPELPAVNLTNECYSYMFYNCSLLTTVPKLPATEMAESCYESTFRQCTKLQAPAKMDHVTTLAKKCCKSMYEGCSDMAVYADDTHEGFAKAWKATSATEGAEDWSKDMFASTKDGVKGAVSFGETYYVTNSVATVTVTIPEVAGATAELYAFDVNGGWLSVATNEVPSNATARVVWTAEDGKTLTGTGAKNVYMWQPAAFVADKAVQEAPAPESVGGTGESEVSIILDTRTNKTYFDAKEILPVWYAKGSTVKVKGDGEASWTDLVLQAADTNTVVWAPESVDTYTLSHPECGLATIMLLLPVEVKTNGLGIAGTTAKVTDDGGQPLVAQTEGEFAGKLIVPSNSTVRVVYTVTESGVYFADGSTTYVAEFSATNSVNDAATMIAAQKPAAPAAPNVKIGVVAQRYPWDGKIDVQYKVANAPAGVYDLKVMAERGGVVVSTTVKDVKSGIGTAVIEPKSAFKEMTSKTCRVSATLMSKN